MIKSEKGISLIEVLIALGILGLVAAAFLSGLATTSKALIIANQRTTAESLVRSQMEYVKEQPYEWAEDDGEVIYLLITGIPITGIPDGYTIWSFDRAGATVTDIIGVPWDSENNQAVTSDAGLQKIKLVIKHHDMEILTLEDYKVDR